ncbi:ABC transporter substrate-binding protein [Streptomyces sp. NPDC006552]|uniref:ABC transporter substrate-binding protein n=1 Tax=Streptomyces sp. NPDC006552 TaxID=3157179 RepID=UPI0033B33694
MTAPPRAPGDTARRTVLRTASAALLAAAGGAVTGCAAGASDGVTADGTVTIQVWHGQTDTALKVLRNLVADFHRAHPDIRVDLGGGVLADTMLQKVTAALASGAYPDVAFVFGSDLASVARSPQAVDLTGYVRDRPTPWTSYWPSARQAVTVNGRVRALPAVVDCLAVVCNKQLFAEAGLALPQPGWSWAEFTDVARRLTDTAGGRFGTGWPGTGDEDTVWRLWPLIWGLGGDVIAEDGKHIGFAEEGVRALEVVRDLVRDRSVYVDPKPGSEQMYKVFLAGRMAMVATGPWQLPDITQAGIGYHVVPLPTFDGHPVTISGPDTWTVFDNGAARARAARTFVGWLTDPAQDSRWDVRAGSLPLSRGSEDSRAWRAHAKTAPGLAVWTDALPSARVRPVHPAYPSISQALGEAVVSVLLGRATPQAALRTCADAADAALLIPR